jgi:hypothetical protein
MRIVSRVSRAIKRRGGGVTSTTALYAWCSACNAVYSFFKVMPPPDVLAAFFSFCISFFCLFDLGGAFCTFLCSLFAKVQTLLCAY